MSFVAALSWDAAASACSFVTMATVCYFIMAPTTLRLTGTTTLRADFVSASVAGVLVLHFFDIISLQYIVSCIVQAGSIQPWAVLTIFFTLAYASVSVDTTGLSKFVALTVLQKFGAGGGNKRLAVVFLLSGIIAVAASNDVVILTLTPVFIHYCEAMRIDPLPVLLVEYYGANTFSAILLVGNPTNIIAAQGMHLSFAAYMILVLPSCVAAIATFVAVLLVRGEQWLPTQLPHEECVQNIIVDSTPSALARAVPCETSAAADSTEIVLQSISEPSGLPTAAPAVVSDEDPAAVRRELSDPRSALTDPTGAAYGAAVLIVGVSFLVFSNYAGFPMWCITSAMCAAMVVWDSFAKSTDPARPNERRVVQVGLRRMPWKTAPFAISMFTMVGALTETGWTYNVSRVFVTLQNIGGAFGCSFVFIWLTVVLMNLLNNQPATIFMIEALVLASDELGTHATQTALCALVVGSNICAALTIAGALAGLMWHAILEAHGVRVTWGQFLVAGLRVASAPICAAGATIFAQSLFLG